MSVRVSRARAVVATGRRPAVVARVAGISRQAIYRPISTRPAAAGPGAGRPGDEAIVEVAKANPTDGTRMVAALASRELGKAVNRKRVQRVMRAHRLLQPTRGSGRRRRPGFFRVRRPDELWHMDMTKVWTAAHGWVYLHVIIDCCTREITGWTLDLRTRSVEAIGCVEGALLDRDVGPETLTIGTDNGAEFQGSFHWHVLDRGIGHSYIKPRTPRLNGKVERSHRIDAEEFHRLLDGVVIDDAQVFNDKLQEWEDFYNFNRPHGGLSGQTPYERLRQKTQTPT